MMGLQNARIGIIGLGYVGLPLAVEFAKKYPVVGFDVKLERIEELASGLDKTLEVSETELNQLTNLSFTDKIEDLADCSIYIVTVPTPIDGHKRPDLFPLLRASETIGRVLARGNVVIYESTVYPGATEEECVPILERISGLKFNQDFFAASQHVECYFLELDAEIFADELSTCQDGNVFKHRFSAIAKARRFNSDDFETSAEAVYNESCKRFAFDVFCDDEEGFARFCNRLQDREELFHR